MQRVFCIAIIATFHVPIKIFAIWTTWTLTDLQSTEDLHSLLWLKLTGGLAIFMLGPAWPKDLRPGHRHPQRSRRNFLILLIVAKHYIKPIICPDNCPSTSEWTDFLILLTQNKRDQKHPHLNTKFKSQPVTLLNVVNDFYIFTWGGNCVYLFIFFLKITFINSYSQFYVSPPFVSPVCLVPPSMSFSRIVNGLSINYQTNLYQLHA